MLLIIFLVGVKFLCYLFVLGLARHGTSLSSIMTFMLLGSDSKSAGPHFYCRVQGWVYFPVPRLCVAVIIAFTGRDKKLDSAANGDSAVI